MEECTNINYGMAASSKNVRLAKSLNDRLNVSFYKVYIDDRILVDVERVHISA